ncbi:hypothetical protein M8998_15105 [Sphingobacterium sp. lm-10]|uniref:hypothetical protein n=1 Tax=Sphingobacterium sp. lm-10 TaxID=2944904 RepID=UPI00202030B6|nr:hypothetical protein [Sphingobacterium sp. lm-10]MCL7989277.1 hypothetical protein [Sphingobacterium sp. lm-10]
MNNFIFTIYCFFLTLLLFGSAAAQERKIDFHEQGPRAHTFYVEAGGPGFLSLNYDTRFRQTRNGWGFRVGLGYIDIDDDALFTVPVQINYLLGKNGNYFEIGGGASLVRNTAPMYYDYYGYNSRGRSRDWETQVMGTLLFGYRRQPVNGGFNFRAGLSPIILDGDFIPYIPHLSFGYSF